VNSVALRGQSAKYLYLYISPCALAEERPASAEYSNRYTALMTTMVKLCVKFDLAEFFVVFDLLYN
jgi:hypothetical protein